MGADEMIKNLGFMLLDNTSEKGYLAYENQKDDHYVAIQWDADLSECFIFSHAISSMKDWYGHETQEPMGLTFSEGIAFLNKIQEMRDLL